jgi:membrane protease YdiL (CAAX protease family)
MGHVWQSVTRIFVVLVAAALFWRLEGGASRAIDDALGPALLKVALWVVPAIVFAMLLNRHDVRHAWRDLGLSGAPWRGLAFGLVATLPMALLLATGRGRLPDAGILAADAILGPFAEEVLFRGFLFLALRRLGYRFWPAAIATSVLFGLAHVIPIWQVLEGGWPAALALQWLEDWADYFSMVLLVNTAGGFLFAWIVEKHWSLWPAIGLHAAINFWSDIIWGEARIPEFPAPEAILWALASCASLVIALLITRHLGRGRAGRVVMSHG